MTFWLSFLICWLNIAILWSVIDHQKKVRAHRRFNAEVIRMQEDVNRIMDFLQRNTGRLTPIQPCEPSEVNWAREGF